MEDPALGFRLYRLAESNAGRVRGRLVLIWRSTGTEPMWNPEIADESEMPPEKPLQRRSRGRRQRGIQWYVFGEASRTLHSNGDAVRLR